MSRSVSFAEGTNVSDSPAKLFNNSAAHSSTKYNLEKRRGELRFNMHKKHTLLSVDDFFKEFVPSPRTRESARIAIKPTRTNIFRGMDTAKNEEQMYNGIVRQVLNFPYVRVTEPWVAAEGPEQDQLMSWLQVRCYSSQIRQGRSHEAISRYGDVPDFPRPETTCRRVARSHELVHGRNTHRV